MVAALDTFDSVGVIDSYFPKADFFTEFERFDRHIDKLRRVNVSIDFLSVCSPNYLHDSHIRFGLKNGADVICEKPLVLNPWNVESLKSIEQETGKKPETSRAFTLLARGGSEQNKARPKARAKPSNNFAKIGEFTIKAKSKQHRLIIFLQMMVDQKKQFIMPRKYKGMGRGIYRIKRKKIVAVQRFGALKVRKDPWMKPTIQNEINSKVIRSMWANNINRILPRRLK